MHSATTAAAAIISVQDKHPFIFYFLLPGNLPGVATPVSEEVEAITSAYQQC